MRLLLEHLDDERTVDVDLLRDLDEPALLLSDPDLHLRIAHQVQREDGPTLVRPPVRVRRRTLQRPPARSRVIDSLVQASTERQHDGDTVGDVLQYVIRRLLWAVVLFVAVTAVTYVIFYVIPANPARLACGQRATEACITSAEHRLGLNRPVPVQYAMFMKRLV